MTRYGHQKNNIKFTYFQASKHFEYRGKMDEATFWWEKYQESIHAKDMSASSITNKHLSLISGGI